MSTSDEVVTYSFSRRGDGSVATGWAVFAVVKRGVGDELWYLARDGEWKVGSVMNGQNREALCNERSHCWETRWAAMRAAVLAPWGCDREFWTGRALPAGDAREYLLGRYGP